jgi:H/ACA ribonucleoprotein complex subunit 4
VLEGQLNPPKLKVIDEEPSDSRYGHIPSERPIPELLKYGIIPLDKPRGPSSHEVVSWVRKLLNVEKAGHSGTLDPPVSGLLPIGLGEATKALGLLLLHPKEYWAIMRLHSSVPRRQLDTVVGEFVGEIYQRPPQRSSVKRQVRSRTIYELEVVEAKGNLYLVRCLCEAGTYIRKLVYDIGEVLGVGATMVELRRTKVGPVTEAEGFVTLHELRDAVFKLKSGDETGIRACVRPIELIIAPFDRVVVRDSAADAICHGARLAVPGILSFSENLEKDAITGILSAKGELIALGKALMGAGEIETAKKGLAVTVERVIMAQGTYPPMWKHQNQGSGTGKKVTPE